MTNADLIAVHNGPVNKRGPTVSTRALYCSATGLPEYEEYYRFGKNIATLFLSHLSFLPRKL